MSLSADSIRLGGLGLLRLLGLVGVGNRLGMCGVCMGDAPK